MNKLIIVFIAFLMFGCSHQKEFKFAQSARDHLFDEVEVHNRKLAWLIYQDDIKKMVAPYPEDIKLIRAFLKNTIEDAIYECKQVWNGGFTKEAYKTLLGGLHYEFCDKKFKYTYLVVIPMFEVSENDHIYVLFDPTHDQNKDFIRVTKGKVSLIDTSKSLAEFYQSMPNGSNAKYLFPARHYILDALR